MNLIRILSQKYTINKKNVLGHSDIAPDRKKDPGEKFPWESLARKKLSIWHGLNKKKLKFGRVCPETAGMVLDPF